MKINLKMLYADWGSVYLGFYVSRNYDILIKKCPIVTHTQQKPREVNTIPFG